jgi:hypothetical protein
MSKNDNINSTASLIGKYGISGAIIAMFLAPIRAFFEGSAGVLAAILNVPVAVTEGFIGSVQAIAEAFLEAPLSVIVAGADTSSRAVGDFYVLALPVGVALALASYYMVQVYLKEEETSDFLPGLPFDVPFIGKEEDDGD